MIPEDLIFPLQSSDICSSIAINEAADNFRESLLRQGYYGNQFYLESSAYAKDERSMSLKFAGSLAKRVEYELSLTDGSVFSHLFETLQQLFLEEVLYF